MTKGYSTQFKQEALHFVQNHPSLAVHTVAKQLVEPSHLMRQALPRYFCNRQLQHRQGLPNRL